MRERNKRYLSWMHLDILITQHLCKAKSYLHSFLSADMNDELSLNDSILYTHSQIIMKFAENKDASYTTGQRSIV